MSKHSLRQVMPETAALIDAMRKEFGAEGIDEEIRRGMRGEGRFWASENGHEIGTPPSPNEVNINPVLNLEEEPKPKRRKS